jgi:hypothetical protein
MSLLEDLQKAEEISAKKAGCPLCILINQIDDEETKEALTRSAAGTIGVNVLTRILSGTGVGNRTIKRHRDEEHTP